MAPVLAPPASRLSAALSLLLVLLCGALCRAASPSAPQLAPFAVLPSPRPRVHLSTFAACSSARRLPQFAREALSSGFFDVVHALTREQLEPAFLRSHGAYLSPSVRGCGYWTWKPQALLQTLLAVPEGDVVVYVDAGASLHPENCARFWHYVTLAAAHPHSVLSFQMLAARQPVEAAWSKADSARHFNLSADSEHLQSPQLHATYFFLTHSASTLALVREWRDAAVAEGYHLVDDSPSARAAEAPGFVEHRHDQSLWSLLRKARGAALLVPDDAAQGGAPVQSTRCRTGAERSCRLRRVKEALWVTARDRLGSLEAHAQRLQRRRCPVARGRLATHEHGREGGAI